MASNFKQALMEAMSMMPDETFQNGRMSMPMQQTGPGAPRGMPPMSNQDLDDQDDAGYGDNMPRSGLGGVTDNSKRQRQDMMYEDMRKRLGRDPATDSEMSDIYGDGGDPEPMESFTDTDMMRKYGGNGDPAPVPVKRRRR